MNIDIKTADGADIELGGTYYDEKGTRYRVTGIRVPDHQALAKSKLYCIKEGSGPVLTNPGSLYLVSPDSLERLRDDLDRFVRNQNGTVCSYLNRERRDCDGCKFKDHFYCVDALVQDVTARVHSYDPIRCQEPQWPRRPLAIGRRGLPLNPSRSAPGMSSTPSAQSHIRGYRSVGPHSIPSAGFPKSVGAHAEGSARTAK